MRNYINQLINTIVPNSPTQTRAHHQVSLPYSSTPSPSFPTLFGSLIPIDSRSEGSLINYMRWTGKKSTNQRRCLVDTLPDDVLLAIFDFCADQFELTKRQIEAWQTLVHVCRRWRSVVFGSPSRLKLRLVCTSSTPAKSMLDVWPALPLIVQFHQYYNGYPKEGVDNIVAVLKRSNRVGQIELNEVSSSDLEKVWAAMQDPFPELTSLQLLLDKSESVTVLPDSFMGGSTPRLQILRLHAIPFPGLPKLLLSAPHLVEIHLFGIPHSGHFPPEAMITALSTLTSLRELRLEFQSPRSRPDPASRRPPPPTRLVLPVLTDFWFKGVSEYLDDLVARIDAPRLNLLDTTFFNQIGFETPQFMQFISRTPTLKTPEKVVFTFGNGVALVHLSSKTSRDQGLKVSIPCRELDWQVSSLEQICALCLPPLSMVEDLYITHFPFWLPEWQDNIEGMLWLELLHPFTIVKNLYLTVELAERIVPALQELGGGMTEVLPTLETIFLEVLHPPKPVQEFVAMRQVTNYPIAVSYWDKKSLWDIPETKSRDRDLDDFNDLYDFYDWDSDDY